MKKVTVNEVFVEKGEVAIVVTDSIGFKTLRMKLVDYEASRIYEGEQLYVHEDKGGNINAVLPDKWVQVSQDRAHKVEERDENFNVEDEYA